MPNQSLYYAMQNFEPSTKSIGVVTSPLVADVAKKLGSLRFNSKREFSGFFQKKTGNLPLSKRKFAVTLHKRIQKFDEPNFRMNFLDLNFYFSSQNKPIRHLGFRAWF